MKILVYGALENKEFIYNKLNEILILFEQPIDEEVTLVHSGDEISKYNIMNYANQFHYKFDSDSREIECQLGGVSVLVMFYTKNSLTTYQQILELAMKKGLDIILVESKEN